MCCLKLGTLAVIALVIAASVPDGAASVKEDYGARNSAGHRGLQQTSAPILTAQEKNGCVVRTGKPRLKIAHGATYCLDGRLHKCDNGSLVNTKKKC